MSAAIEQRLEQLFKRMGKLEQLIRAQPASNDWISEEEAMSLTGLGKSSLQKYRRAGKIQKWRTRPSGKGIQYSENELQELFIST